MQNIGATFAALVFERDETSCNESRLFFFSISFTFSVVVFEILTTWISNGIKHSGIKLKKISVSCGLNQSKKKPIDLLKALWDRYEILLEHNVPLIWQLDGRPMSGDLAPTTGKDTVKLWENIGSQLPPGLIQLAGGTNGKTHEFLKINNYPDGIAFGSYARKIMQPLIEYAYKNNKKLYEYPEKMSLAIKIAKNLLKPWKVS